MKQQKRANLTQASYFFIALILLTYILFPSLYVSLSQKLFYRLYARGAPPVPHVLRVGEVFGVPGSAIPLRVLAQPPQVPHDFLLASVPSGAALSDAVPESLEGHYVYNSDGVIIGRARGRHGSLHAIRLFSSPGSRELFSVGDHVSEGVGAGNGSFFLRIPAHASVSPGDPITHQVTGSVMSSVTVAEYMPEKHAKRVVGMIDGNALETSLVYVSSESPGFSVEDIADYADRLKDAARSDSDRDAGAEGDSE